MAGVIIATLALGDLVNFLRGDSVRGGIALTIAGTLLFYLLRHFATESGKSKGQFYTPAEVSRMMAKVIGAGRVKPVAVFRFVSEDWSPGIAPLRTRERWPEL